jgi:multicomponent Na+:H+ antiporter subunit G
MTFGVIGIYKFKNIYARILNTSKIDSVSFITLILALVFTNNFGNLSLRLLIILIFYMLTNPVINHLILNAAFINKVGKKEDKNA